MKMLLSFGRLVLAVVITCIFGSTFSGWINRTFIHPPVFEWVYEKTSYLASNALSGVNEFPQMLTGVFGDFLNFDAFFEKHGSTVTPSNALISDVSAAISDTLSAAISANIGYVLLFALSFAILTVAIRFVGIFAELPLIKTGDKLLGLAVGAVNGLVAVSWVSSVLYLIVHLTGDLDAYENSVIFKLVKDINLFGFVFDRLLK